MGEKWTINQVARTFQVTPRALRHYEAVELMAPERVGSRRTYSKREIARLKLILRGRRIGLGLEQIRQLLDLWDKQKPEVQLKAAYEVAEKQLATLIARRDELEQATAELKGDMQQISNMLEQHFPTKSASQQ